MKSLIKIMLFFCFANTAFAQNTLTREAAIAAALQNHPAMRAAALEVKAKKHGERAAVNVPNPELNVESPTGEFYTLGVSQSFEFPTVYARQKALAKAETSLAQAGQSVSEGELRYKIRMLYLEAQVSASMSDLWRERDTLYQQMVAAAARQFDAGEIDFLQKTIAENEAGAVSQARLASELSTSSARVQLGIMTGVTNFGDLEPLAPDTSLEQRFVSPEDGLKNPSVAYLQQQAQVAERQVELAKSRALPNFSLGYMNQGVRNTPIDYRFRASIGIPLWAGQYLAGQKMARAESQAAVAKAEAQSQALSIERQSAIVEMIKAQEKLDYYTKDALPRSRSLITAATRMREAGQIDYVNYLRILDGAFAIQQDHIAQLQALHTAQIQTMFLSGQ